MTHRNKSELCLKSVVFAGVETTNFKPTATKLNFVAYFLYAVCNTYFWILRKICPTSKQIQNADKQTKVAAESRIKM